MQIVPGPVPCLVPAYLLTVMGSVIDMVGLRIYHTNLGTFQDMRQRLSGHVEVSLTEFGEGFRAPVDLKFDRSQVWERGASGGTFEPHFQIVDATGRPIQMPPALAALAAALAAGLCQPGPHCALGRGSSASPTSSPSHRAQRRERLEPQILDLQQQEGQLLAKDRSEKIPQVRNMMQEDEGDRLRPWSTTLPDPSFWLRFSEAHGEARGQQGVAMVSLRDMRFGGANPEAHTGQDERVEHRPRLPEARM